MTDDTKLAAHDQVLEAARTWHREGRGAALATVLETWGSAPRPVGSVMAVSGAQEMVGSVSGGCVEGAVVAEAVEALAQGGGTVLDFGVSDDDAFAVGLACGGRISVRVDPVGTESGIPPAILDALVAARARREAIVLATAVDQDPPEFTLVRAGDTGTLGDRAAAAMRFDRSGFAADGERRWFLTVCNPPLRLVVVGGSHIAQPLVTMAAAAGYDVTLVDPRDAFASVERFPGVRILRDWPDAALRAHGLDARVGVVTLTHDAKLDDPAIVAALGSDAFYIGCLGSTRTHARRIGRLRAAGIGEAALQRLRAPVGLRLGARSPAEIAVAILAEVTATLRLGSGREAAA